MIVMSAYTMLFYTQLISGVWFDEKGEDPKILLQKVKILKLTMDFRCISMSGKEDVTEIYRFNMFFQSG